MARIKSQGPDLPHDEEYIPRIGFERLCAAVVAQAAKDRAWWFFESSAIKLYLTERVDPLALMCQIKKNYEVYGRWSAVDTTTGYWNKKEVPIQ